MTVVTQARACLKLAICTTRFVHYSSFLLPHPPVLMCIWVSFTWLIFIIYAMHLKICVDAMPALGKCQCNKFRSSALQCSRQGGGQYAISHQLQPHNSAACKKPQEENMQAPVGPIKAHGLKSSRVCPWLFSSNVINVNDSTVSRFSSLLCKTETATMLK